ncbi:unnamed protein product [Durusdinium trenchii]|uniref:Uncharacterized protein n=1 Tax=Durusdinium trenchii TaxID=1381693 RepID=A0ABP0J556_9DINO
MAPIVYPCKGFPLDTGNAELDVPDPELTGCTPLCLVVILVSFLVMLLLVCITGGWLRLAWLRSHLKASTVAHDYEVLHTASASFLKYGPWCRKAHRLIAERKEKINQESQGLGISLHFVLEELGSLYAQKAQEVEWRLNNFGPVTRVAMSVLLRHRQASLMEDFDAIWDGMPATAPPEDPNFHQLAGLLAYGPHALGKGHMCPRDGRMDCSIVDVLWKEGKSAPATWFLSYVWGYALSSVFKALSRWFTRHRIVTEVSSKEVFIWWCVFVNNQFRILQDGEMHESQDLFNVFTRLLQRVGKVLMCMDSFRGTYTTRIWCVFEVFCALRADVPITLIVPEVDADFCGTVTTVKDLCQISMVDCASASASNPADADAIKDHIKRCHASFEHVNQAVERCVQAELLSYLSQVNTIAVSSPYDELEARRYISEDLGVSLSFVAGELQSLYHRKAQETEWRSHGNCKVTQSGFNVKIRDCADVESGACLWDDLEVCKPPENPNFHQLAGLLAYGPHALGKGHICPRDGKVDCSLVDVLWKEGKSDRANWFLSWAWTYFLNDVCHALARWWDRESRRTHFGRCAPMTSVYVWWCFFVNNQFRMLQDGETVDTDSLLEVFAKPLARANKVLMCVDKFQNSTYNDRIDAAVQAVAQPCADSLSAWARRVDDAMAWSSFAIARQKQALLDLRRHVESSALS